MKIENKILSLVAFFGIILLLVNPGTYSWNITGSVIEGQGYEVEDVVIASDLVVTEQVALDFIEEAETVRDRMFENNFSTTFVDDNLIEAKREFEKVKYAEVLRNSSSSAEDIQKAREILSLVNWEEISYADILVYINIIKERESAAFDIYDLLVVSEIKIKDYADKEVDVLEAQDVLDEATIAFYEDKYEDAQILIEDVRDVLELELAQSTRVSVLARGAKNFFQKNWFYIILFLFLFGILGFFLFEKIHRNLLVKKVYKLKIEQGVLSRLIKRAQIERFKEHKISKTIYDLRIKKYGEKINEIKEILPVLEKELVKNHNFKTSLIKRFYRR